MKITSADFVISCTDIKQCPAPSLPEYAFIGRSNVGKSSLINMLTNKKELARTSVKPGKTQLINHFIINEKWYLVDLPGYGYAAVGKDKKEEFSQMIRRYMQQRQNLMCVFVLIDSRIPMQANDKSFMEWLAEHEVPFCMIFTKADKQSKTKLAANLEAYKTKMLESWEHLPTHFVTSAEEGLGKEDVLGFIEDTNRGFRKVK